MLFEGHNGWVNSISFSPDGGLIATCDDDGYVLLWRAREPERGRLLGVFVAIYEISAVYWHDAYTLILADTGGPSGHPHFYNLKLHGME